MCQAWRPNLSPAPLGGGVFPSASAAEITKAPGIPEGFYPST